MICLVSTEVAWVAIISAFLIGWGVVGPWIYKRTKAAARKR